MLIKPILRIVFKLVTLLLYALTFVAAYGGKINPCVFAYGSWLMLIFPYLVIASMLAVALWCWQRKFITAGLGGVMLFSVWGPLTTAVPLSFPKEATHTDRTFTVLTYNIIHGWDQQQIGEGTEYSSDFSKQKGNRSFDYVLNSGADIVALQEVMDLEPGEIPNMTKGRVDSLLKVYPYYAPRGYYHGASKLFSKYPVKLIKKGIFLMQFEVSLPWGKLNLINVHLNSYRLSPEERGVVHRLASGRNTKKGVSEMKGTIRTKLNVAFCERARHAQELAEMIRSTRGPLIVCGDFNDVPASYVYNQVVDTGLKDAYVDTSFGPMVTYNRFFFWFHLDQVFYTPDYLKALRVWRGNLRSSDHYPVSAEFEYLRK